MSIASCRWVLWVSLMLLLPLPVLLQHVGWVSAGYILQLLIHSFTDPVAATALVVDQRLLLAGQLLMWSLILSIPGVIYGKFAIGLPLKQRGSLVGLLAISLLILFSTFTVYSSLLDPQLAPFTFLQLYHQH